ncbi:MAG: sulfatase [Candidatus Aminicenantes bacterium]|nr:sulfatase [Candidatus Aminicenantes bacterium]
MKIPGRMKRREFIKLAGASAAAGLAYGSSAFSLSAQSAPRPNVLLIMVDDLRPELGCYGVDQIHTPHIDRFAQRGLVFNRAYCPQAICNPTRASLLTGMRPDSLRVWDNNTHFRKKYPGIMTLPQIFKMHGYQTISVGKVFHGTLPDPPSWDIHQLPPVDYKFYQSKENQDRQKAREKAARMQGYSESWINYYLRGPATESCDAPDNYYRDGALTEIAIDMLSKFSKKQPFFLSVGFSKPHLPFVAPQRYWDLYDRKNIPLAPNNYIPKGAPSFAINSLTGLKCHEDFVLAPPPAEGSIPEEQARLLKHGYYACISFIDAQIGRILNNLTSLALEENTIVVVLGDSGYKLGEHGSWGKRTNYEIDVRCLLIISVPGQTSPGNSTSALVELVDLHPTLCELAGFQTAVDLEGLSFIPILQNPGRPWKRAAFSQFARGFSERIMGRSMRTDRYRFIEWRERFDNRLIATELYDHEVDPQENKSIAGNPRYIDLVAQLSSMLASGWKAALPE